MFQSVRLTKTYEMRVPASPEQLFPLLCPVREREWLPYWDCRMIYSTSGTAEADCVFTTDFPGRGNMTWVVTRYEPPERIQYTVFKPESHTWTLSIRLVPAIPNESGLTWQHVFTGLTEAGNLYLRDYTDELHRLNLQNIERRLTHFVKTGKMLAEEGLAKKTE
jgi:hypothetical protein